MVEEEALGDEKVAEVEAGAVEPPPMTLPQAVFRDKTGAPDPGAEIPEVVDLSKQHEEATISVTPDPEPETRSPEPVTHLDIGAVRDADERPGLPSPPTLQVETSMLDSPKVQQMRRRAPKPVRMPVSELSTHAPAKTQGDVGIVGGGAFVKPSPISRARAKTPPPVVLPTVPKPRPRFVRPKRPDIKNLRQQLIDKLQEKPVPTIPKRPVVSPKKPKKKRVSKGVELAYDIGKKVGPKPPGPKHQRWKQNHQNQL